MKRAVCYVRVSSDQQAEKGLSLGAQEQKCRAMCQAQDLEAYELLRDDGQSAKTLDRPAMQDLLELVRRHEVQYVVVAKLDRLTRSVRDLLELVDLFNDNKVALISCSESLDTSSAVGRMVLKIIGTVAEWEREAIVERTVDALRHKKLLNEMTGRPPYGKRLNGDGLHLEDNPEELEVLRQIRALRSEGLSVRQIARKLNMAGVPRRHGTLWDYQFVGKLMKRHA